MKQVDYWDKIALAANQKTREREFWKSQLAGDFVKSFFPFDFKLDNENKKNDSLGEISTPCPENLAKKIIKVSGGMDIKLHMVMEAGLEVLLSKYCGSTDIVTGSCIVKQKSEANFINTILVYRNWLPKEMTVKELLIQVKKTVIKAAQNQNYPLEFLAQRLNLPAKPAENPLFDVVLLLENIHEPKYLEGIDFKILISILRDDQVLKVKIHYRKNLYLNQTIERITRHFFKLLDQIASQPDTPISMLEILTDKEKKQLLEEFNCNSIAYSDNKTIGALFSLQVDRNKDQVALVGPTSNSLAKLSYQENSLPRGQITYRELQKRAAKLARKLREDGVNPDTVVAIMVERSLEMVVAVISVIMAGGAYLPLDPDYPAERIDFMLKDSQTQRVIVSEPLQTATYVKEKSQLISLNDNEDLGKGEVVNMVNHPHHLVYVIYTSGSTGKPKGVLVQHSQFVNAAYAWRKEYHLEGNPPRLLQMAPFSFDVFAGDIARGLLNGGKMVITTRSNIDPESLSKLISRYGITLFESTPAYLVPFMDYIFGNNLPLPTLKLLILGSDICREEDFKKIRERFGQNMRIINSYGVTEATIDTSYFEGALDYSTPSGNVPIGKVLPNMHFFILNNHGLLQPLGVTGELYIGGHGVARGYLNRPELTAEKFIQPKIYTHMYEFIRGRQPSYSLSYPVIYRTGDLARWLPDGNVEFLGRKDNQVKVRGFRIELGEIENRLQTHTEIKEAVVLHKTAENGDKYLCGYFVSEKKLSPEYLREFLGKELPDYMVPWFYLQLDRFPLTPNGKIDRNALPEPESSPQVEYVPPRNQWEEKIVDLWSDVLGAEKNQIGIDTNFFDLGGNSLKAVVLISRMHKEMETKLQMIDIFSLQTIRAISGKIKENEPEKFISINPIEKKEYYPLAPAQKRLYVVQQMDLSSKAYNMPMMVPVEKTITLDQLKKIIKSLIHRHDSLRTSFTVIEGEPFQRIHDEVDFKIENFSIAGDNDSDVRAASPDSLNLEDCLQQFIRPFDLSQAPLLRAGLVPNRTSEQLLLLDMHHIITDGTSQVILKDEFIRLLQRVETGFPMLKLQYKDYTGWLYSPVQRKIVKNQENFWTRILSAQMPVLTLPLDYTRPEFQSFEGSSLQFVLKPAITRQLKELTRETGSTLYMILLGITTLFLSKLSGQEDIILGTPVIARRHADLQRIVGMFVNTLVMRNYPLGHKTLKQFFNEVKKHTLEVYENQEYPFEDLVDKIGGKRDTSRNPLFDVMFNLMNLEEYSQDIPETKDSQSTESRKVTAKFDLNLTAVDMGKSIYFEIEYCTRLFKESTIHRFIQYFKKISSQVVKPSKRRIKLSEIQLISFEERQQLVLNFNNTTVEFPSDETLSSLFTEQTSRSESKIALIFRENNVSYWEMQKKTDALANFLRIKGVESDSVVGLMVERSIEMVVGILAILKAGGAYLPIDVEYPETRKTYMIKDSSVKFLLSNCLETGWGKKDAITEDIECIDLNDEACYSDNNIRSKPEVKPSNMVYLIYTSGSTGKPKGVVLEHENLVNLILWGYRYTNLEFQRVLQFATISFDVSFHEIFSTLLSGGRLLLIDKEVRTDILKLFELIQRNFVKTVFLPMSLLKIIFSEEEYIRAFPASIIHIQTAGEQVVVNDKFRKYLQSRKIYFHNHYGPSEAHVVTALTMNPHEDIPALPTIGKPVSNTKIFILDKYDNLQPVGVPGELLIGGIQVGRGYLNRPELTAVRFVQLQSCTNVHRYIQESPLFGSPTHPYTRSVLYRTGDLARWQPDGNIEFFGRIDHQVKIRGFRIELGEIETELVKHELIKDAVVVVFSPQGIEKVPVTDEKYLCAYLVKENKPGKEMNFSQLRDYLSQSLPSYMLPSLFIPVENIPLTPNGKVDRKNLPNPSLEEMGVGKKYTGPRNKIERKLVKIWAETLNRENNMAAIQNIGIDDNFFELGGHSLKATIMTSKIHKEFNVKIPLSKVFKAQTIRELSEFITGAKESKYAGIEPVEKKEYYTLSSAQKRIYILQQMNPQGIEYNMPMIFPLGKDIEKKRLEFTLKRLVARHENLRTSFVQVREIPVQRVYDKVEFEVEYFFIMEEREGPEVTAIIQDFIRPFDLSRTPLLRSGIIELPDGNHIWLVDMHHIISDGTSHTILTEDFLALYSDGELNPLRLHYKDYSQWQNRLFAGGEIAGQEQYWLELLNGEVPRLELAEDYKRPPVYTFAGDSYWFKLDSEETSKLRAMNGKYGITLYMNILAILNTLFFKYTGQTDIIIGSGVAGRPHADLQQIIGMFVNTLIMRNNPSADKSFAGLLTEVRETAVKAFENQDVQFEELVEKLNIPRDPSRNPLFDVSMVVQNYRRPGESAKKSTGNNYTQNEVLPLVTKDIPNIDFKSRTTKFDITFFIIESKEEITAGIEYYTGVFKPESIKRLAARFKQVIKGVVDNPLLKLKEIEIISEQEKETLLDTFNQTAEDYPCQKTLISLFHEQVERTPHHAALVNEGEILTYYELQKRAAQLAAYLYYEKGIAPGLENPVGILISRPLALAEALLGVLEAGGVYVPLDPQLPRDRIKYMICDAGIGTVLSGKDHIHLLNRLQWECNVFHSYLCKDSLGIYEEEEGEENQLMNRELWHHVAENAEDEITGGGWISSYTGNPFSKAEMDEYGDNILKKLSPLLHPKIKVLEIGCASGISMFRLAPLVGLYYGTDLSRIIIRKNEERIRKEGIQNIKLAVLPAHELEKLEEKDFDLVIMNSVIQCFHGYNYLRKVLRQIIRLIGDKGNLFVGDVMDLDKKESLSEEMRAFKYAPVNKDKGYTTKTDFSSELFIAKAAWKDLEIDFKEIAAVEFSDKIYTIENELTKFRYDVLIKFDKATFKEKGKEKSRKREKFKNQEDMNHILALGREKYLQARQLSFSIQPGHLAYIIYTSGSTGKPKGVEVEHGGIVNTLLFRKETYKLKPGDISLQLFSYAFDGFVASFFTPLVAGSKLILLKKEELGDIEKIKRAILDEQVSHFISVPPLYAALLDNAGGENIASLQVVALAGDKTSPRILELTVNKNPSLEIANEYGVTEGSVMSTIYRHQERDDIIKIGHPIANTRLYILDARMCLQPIGVAGELCIEGYGLARGYLNKPELTREKFLPIPGWNDNNRIRIKTRYSNRMYTTGDLARWLSDGEIQFLGRIDYQVKIRGYRIELGEIESRLSMNETIKKAVVVDLSTDNGEKYLCAYIVSTEAIDIQALKDFLSSSLPEYMVPAFFVPLDEIPLTISGKLDRKALPDPERMELPQYMAPMNEIQKKMAVIWSEVLQVEEARIGIHTNFFELGGHSLKATILTAKIHKELNIKVPLAEVFKHQTIYRLTNYIKGRREDKYAGIEAGEKREYYALSSAQKRLYFIQQLDKKNITYNMPLLLPLGKDIEIVKLENTLNRLISRHESLRTSFLRVDEEPVQRIYDTVDFHIEYFNISKNKEEPESKGAGKSRGKGKDKERTHGTAILPENEQRIGDIITDFIRPFDLSQAPLIRSGLIKLAKGDYIWMVDIHHIVSDGTSQMILTDDFLTMYEGGDLPELRLHYKDFSLWQDRLSVYGEMEKQKEYWLNLFSSGVPHLELATDNKRPEVFTFAGARHSFVLEREEARKFTALGNKNGATLFMNFLAVLNILFYKYTGQEDIVIGGVIAGRPHADLQKIIGMFINTLAMRNAPCKEKTYESFLKEVVNNSLEAFANQDVQFERLVEDLNLQRDTSRNPLFDITMAVQNFQKPGEGKIDADEKNRLEVLPAADESLSQVEYKPVTSKFDMTFLIHEIGDEILIEIEYYTAIFKEETIRRLETHFKKIVDTITAESETGTPCPLADIEIITGPEKEEILNIFNNTTCDYPREKSIPRLFEEQTAQKPAYPALVERKQNTPIDRESNSEVYMTYRQLDKESTRIAKALKEKGVPVDTIVAVKMARGINLVSAILGILKAGAAYLPIDPEYPEERRQYLQRESNCDYMLESDNTGSGHGLKILNINKNNDNYINERSHFNNRQAGNRNLKSTNLAYTLYTSGTTGRPKGVLVEHRCVIRLVKNTGYVEFKSSDHILQTGALDFDASTFEIWGTLLNGLTLYLTPKEEIISARLLKYNIRRFNITILWLTAPLFNQMVEEDEEIFAGIRHFLVGGDALSPLHINRLIQRYPELKITNGYGPTENTTFSTTLSIERQYSDSIPIGNPIANSTVYILGPDDQIQPKGLVGEILVGGDGVARGYLNNPELTADKFIRLQLRTDKRHSNSYSPSLHRHALDYPFSGSTVYRTGDRGRWYSDGTIEFLGRIDSQVKIRGYRIEVEEIQQHLIKHEQVTDAVVLVKKDSNGEKYLCAYVIPGTINADTLKSFLSRKVPAYMVPGLFVPLEKFPLTPGGKIDRLALAQLGEFRRSEDDTYLAPGTHLEKIIAAAWQEVLKLENVGLGDNFFDMGGNSINLLKLHSKLEKSLEIEIPVVKLFEHTTVSSLAQFLGQLTGSGEDEIDIEQQRDQAFPQADEKITRIHDVAVIGMAGVFPEADNVHEFWENLKNGVESIAFFTDEELEKAGVPAQLLADPNYVKAKGVIEGTEYFDAAFFDYTPREATIMDPQMRMFHQCAWHALEDGGYNSFVYPGRIGLYAGSTSNFYWEALAMFSGNSRYTAGIQGRLLYNRDFMCTRVSYKLNLKGPSYSVQTACSTSLVAIHLACRGLIDGECDMALAGGVTVSPTQTVGYYYQEGMIESPDGHCRAFDASSKGLVGGNGAGAVLLKPLETAVAQGDHIYAVIKGSAANNDGLRKVGYSAPSVEGQAEVVRSAQVKAGVQPESITYIETHGTGTELGDPVEIEALKKVFKGVKKGNCGLGSVKSNMGHLDAAAGVTGFLKAVLSLKHRLIPPNLHFTASNPKLGIEGTPFFVVNRLLEWPEGETPRRAGVSSLGIGGTNAHIILEEAPKVPAASESETTESPLPVRSQPNRDAVYLSEPRLNRLIILSAKSKTAIEKISANLVRYFRENPGVNLADAAYTLQVGRKACEVRKMFVCSTPAEAVELLSSRGKDRQKRARLSLCKITRPPLVFIFSGQGSQYVGMGWRLYQTEPLFREEMERCFEIAESCGYDLKNILYPLELLPEKGKEPVNEGFEDRNREKGKGETPPINSQAVSTTLENECCQPADSNSNSGTSLNFNRTVVVQLLLFIFEYSLARLFIRWGVRPSALIGYSLGEYAAACIAGVFSVDDAIQMVATRGELIETSPEGAMLSVPLGAEELKPLLNDKISLAINNGPSCVVAGSAEAIAEFEGEMKQKRLLCTRVNISHAVHSNLMEPVRKPYTAALDKITLNPPRIPVISNVSGRWLTRGEAVDPRYWAEQMCAPVRYSEGITQLIKEDHSVFIEIGPGRVLGNIIRQHPDLKSTQKVVNPVRHQQENTADDYLLHRAMGQLWLYGIDVDWLRYNGNGNGDEKRYRLSMPVYPFHKKRYWIDEDVFAGIKGIAKGGIFEKPEKEDISTGDETAQPAQTQLEEDIFQEEAEAYEAPRNELEKNIAQIWQEFLGFERIGVFDNFFHLNGDSLTATQLITRIKEIYPVEVTLQDFFAEPTIAHLAQVIKKLLIQKIKSLSPEERKRMMKMFGKENH